MTDDGDDIVFHPDEFEPDEFEVAVFAAPARLATMEADAEWRANNPRRAGYRPLEADIPEDLVDEVRKALRMPAHVPLNFFMELHLSASKNRLLPGQNEVWVLTGVESMHDGEAHLMWIQTLMDHPQVVRQPLVRYGAETILYRVCPR